MTDRLFLRRIQGDVKDLDRNRNNFVQGIQDNENIKLFYFMLRPLEAPYAGGLFMGKIELPDDYPKTPGTFYMLTPSGRFAINAKICLTNSSYHKENWTPIWSIRNMIVGIISIFVADDTTGISHIKDTTANREKFAKESIEFNLKNYPDIFKRFNFFVNPDGTVKTEEEVNKIINERKSKKDKGDKGEENGEGEQKDTVVEIKSEPEPELKPEPIVVAEVVKPEPVQEQQEQQVKDAIKVKKTKHVRNKSTTQTEDVKDAKEVVFVKQDIEDVEDKKYKIIRRVVKLKEEVQVTQEVKPEEVKEEQQPKKVVKRVVKKKVVTATDKPEDNQEDKQEDKPVDKPKKVVKRVVKKKTDNNGDE
jgi:ubiquitin-protein ligase